MLVLLLLSAIHHMSNMKSKNLDSNGTLGKILQQIYRLDVALKDDHLSKKQLLLSFLTNFKAHCFKKSPVFAKYFEHFYLTGSYFEGLRVKEATEFDVNVAFSFPFGDFSYLINELDIPLSYATARVKAFEDFHNIPFFDSSGYLIGKKILQWFQSCLDSFLNTNVQYPDVLRIKTSNSGPARTIKVLYKTVWISIDLVPVFSLNAAYLNKHTMYDEGFQADKEMKTCYLVPKPLKPELAKHLPLHMHEKVWRIHFPEAEKVILANKKRLKQVIKLVKALRDKEDWPLPSYFLKVVAFWLVKRHPQENFWKRQDLGSLFLLFLEDLKDHLDVQQLGHIFYPDFNLFHCLHSTLLRNLHLRVKNIIRQLKNKPNSALILFKVMLLQSSPIPSLIQY